MANIMDSAGYDVFRECYISSCVGPKETNETMVKLRLLGVVLSSWFYERQLYESDLKETMEELDIMGNIRRDRDGIWFIADARQALLVKDGKYTDVAMRIAYYRKKIFKEGYDIVIGVSDKGRDDMFELVRAVMVRLGCEPQRLEYTIVPDYNQALDGIDRNALRFMLSGSTDKVHNALFDVQYAYARICSILRHMDTSKLTLMPPEEIDFSMLRHSAEQALMRRLTELPHKVMLAAERRRPDILTDYLTDIAYLFHGFYDECRVRISNSDLMYARLGLLEAARIVLANGLYILNIEAPERL